MFVTGIDLENSRRNRFVFDDSVRRFPACIDTRARTVLRLVTLECQTFYFLDLCCYCNTRDVTCVSFVRVVVEREKRRGESNSISRMNRRWCVPLTAGACLIEMFYVQCPVGQFSAPPCSS
jgi:hypothetical protein